MVKGKRIKRTSAFSQYQCRDCAHHYDENSQALDGHMILCRCPFSPDGYKYIFMKDPACDHFKMKEQ